MAAVFPAAKYRTIGAHLTDTDPVVVYTVPNEASADVTWITTAIAATGYPSDVLVTWYDATVGSVFAIPFDKQIGQVECMPLRMDAGDAIAVKGHAGDDVVVTYIEYPVRPTGV